jgi:hypothetical protein
MSLVRFRTRPANFSVISGVLIADLGRWAKGYHLYTPSHSCFVWNFNRRYAKFIIVSIIWGFATWKKFFHQISISETPEPYEGIQLNFFKTPKMPKLRKFKCIPD